MTRHRPSRLTFLCLLLLSMVTVSWVGCSSTSYPRLTAPSDAYLDALASTEPLEVTPDNEQAALHRLMDLFRNFHVEYLRENTKHVYADTFFFRDGFKELHQIDELEAYMVHSAEPVRHCTFEFATPIKSGHDYFLQWTMELSLKRDDDDRMDRAIGMSHIRFNREGKVVFHQDYWDPTDILYRRIPIANRLIGYVRSKL